jgi:hypothetical protein
VGCVLLLCNGDVRGLSAHVRETVRNDDHEREVKSLLTVGEGCSPQDPLPASQAENAGSIPVARSKEFGLKPNDCKDSFLTSSDHDVPPLTFV